MVIYPQDYNSQENPNGSFCVYINDKRQIKTVATTSLSFFGAEIIHFKITEKHLICGFINRGYLVASDFLGYTPFSPLEKYLCLPSNVNFEISQSDFRGANALFFFKPYQFLDYHNKDYMSALIAEVERSYLPPPVLIPANPAEANGRA
jgi:hypothetical protein